MVINWCHHVGQCCLVLCFFFKQKTAYEMRISDWSSDVCSSDLQNLKALPVLALTAKGQEADRRRMTDLGVDDFVTKPFSNRDLVSRVTRLIEIGRASCRERVCQYV